jgi:glycosyltransferase involved in cell wall biosynthesis
LTLASEIPLHPDDSCDAPGPAPVRVAFFSDAFPERNGTGAYYHDLLAQLAGRVEDVAVFQPLDDGRKPLLSMALPGDPGQRLVTPPLREIRRACDRIAPDVIVVVTPGLYGLLGVWEARRRGATLLAAFHTDFEQLARMYWNPVSRFFVNIVLRSANRIVCRASRCVLINNGDLRADVDRLGAREVEVIGTPLACAFISRPLAEPVTGLRRVCFAGRLAPEKNVEYIIEAARELPDIEFVIAGDGPLRESLQRDAADCANVRFLGWLQRSSLIDLIDSASLLLLPSAFETFGSVALEAMARGRPALVSTRAGIHAWPSLHEGLFAIDDPRRLGAKLRELRGLGDDEWVARSRAARRVAANLNERTLVHWQELLLRHRPALTGATGGPA